MASGRSARRKNHIPPEISLLAHARSGSLIWLANRFDYRASTHPPILIHCAPRRLSKSEKIQHRLLLTIFFVQAPSSLRVFDCKRRVDAAKGSKIGVRWREVSSALHWKVSHIERGTSLTRDLFYIALKQPSLLLCYFGAMWTLILQNLTMENTHHI